MPENTFELFSSQSWHEYTQDLSRNIENYVAEYATGCDSYDLELCESNLLSDFTIDDILEFDIEGIELKITEPEPAAEGKSSTQVNCEASFPYDGSELFFQIRPTAWIYQAQFAELVEEDTQTYLIQTFTFSNASDVEIDAIIQKNLDQINSALNCLRQDADQFNKSLSDISNGLIKNQINKAKMNEARQKN